MTSGLRLLGASSDVSEAQEVHKTNGTNGAPATRPATEVRAAFSVAGWGTALPRRTVTNDDLAQHLDTSDEWISARTGIRERRIGDADETTGRLALDASQRALAQAGLTPADLDVVIVATSTPEQPIPSTAAWLASRLGSPAGAFDINAACAGFVYGLTVGGGLLEARVAETVLLVGADSMSRFVDPTDRATAVLFGDGAGAVVVEVNEDPANPGEILEVRLHAEGSLADKLWIEAPGSGFQPVRITRELIEQKRHFPRMEGRLVFKHATRRMPEVLLEALSAASLKIEDVDHFLFHQANLRINEYVAQQLGIPPEKCPSNIDRYGNCSAASIPMLLDEGVRAGRIRPGQLVAMTSFGSGFSWTSALVRWG